MSIAFAIMSVLMLPALISNLVGEYFASRNAAALDYTTLGNQIGYDDDTTDPNSLNVSKENVEERAVYLTSDLLSTVAFFIFLIVFKIICKLKIRDLLRETQTPSDYAIYVTGFPDDAVSKEEMITHFSKFGPVQEVIFSRRFAKLIKDYRGQDTLNKRMKKREIIVKIKAAEQGEDIGDAVRNDKKCQKLIQQDNEMEERLRKKYPHIKSIGDVPKIGAFIIFDKAEDNVEVLRAYHKTRVTYPEDLKLNGQYKIKVRDADEPSNILWENLEVGWIESFIRTFIVGIVVFVLLACTFFAVYWLRSYQNNLPEVEDCDQYDHLTLSTVDKNNRDALN